MNKPEKLSRRRGASGWAITIYNAVWEAADDGYHCSLCPGGDHAGCLSNAELQQYCERQFNMSGTIQWYQHHLHVKHSKHVNDPGQIDYPEAVAEKLKITRRAMSARREITNIASKMRPVWILGDNAPRYWKPRHVQPGGFREYIHPRVDVEQKRATRRMKSGWPAEVRAELARSKPRPSQMQALLEEALDIYA